MVSTKCTISRAETHAGLPEGDLGVLLVPAGQEVHRHAGGQHQQPAAPVEGEHRDGRECHEQHPGGQRAHAGVQEFAQGLQVRGLPGDDAPGGVLFVEFQAQPLGVPEDPDAQVQQHRLAEFRRRGHVQGGQAGRGDGRGEVRDAGQDQREVVAGAQRRQGAVDPEGDQRRPGHARGLGEDDGGDGQPEPPPDGADQGAQQGQGPPLDGFALAPGEVGVVLVGGAEGCAAHREISSASRADSSESRSRGSVRQAGNHVAVVAVLRQQPGVGPDGGDPAVLEQRHPVRQRHGGRPVGHDEGGGVGEDLAQPGLDAFLGVDVQRRERVVEDQHLGPGGDGAGQGDALPLAAGQAQALLADQGVHAVGQGVGEVRLGDVEGLLQGRLAALPPIRRRGRRAGRCPAPNWRTGWCPRRPRRRRCGAPRRRIRAGPRRRW